MDVGVAKLIPPFLLFCSVFFTLSKGLAKNEFVLRQCQWKAGPMQ